MRGLEALRGKKGKYWVLFKSLTRSTMWNIFLSTARGMRGGGSNLSAPIIITDNNVFVFILYFETFFQSGGCKI